MISFLKIAFPALMVTGALGSLVVNIISKGDKHIMSDADVGYGAVNIPIAECTVCGCSWRGSNDVHVCPGCGRDEREPID